jgi:transcriptional regulator with XRE-family HTH domain
MEPGDRVRIIRKEAGLTQEKFGERLGISKVAVSKIENKVNSLSDQMRKSICREFRINEEWLLSGTGEMHVSSGADLITRFSTEYGLDSLERTILLEYVKLSPQSKQMFKAYLKSISERLINDNLQPKDDTLRK